MAEPAAQREGANESRLRKERRGVPAGGAEPGPSASDQAAETARRMRTERASDEAAAQNIERRQGITQKAGVQIDRKRIEYTPETRVGDLTISRGRQVTEREEIGAGARDRAAGAAMRQQRLESQLTRQRRQEGRGEQAREGGAPSLRDAAMLAKATPAGAAAGAAAGALTGQLSTADIQRGVGRGCILSLWGSLWLTFGHTIYFIGLLFFIAWSSRYARKYFPEIGEEWFPGPLLKKIPKTLLIPIKLGETIGILFITFWVFMLDMLCLGLFALILGLILSAARAVPGI